MASSSDLEKARSQRGFLPPQNEEERRLMHRIEELCHVAASRDIPRYTGFLSDREQVLAQAACHRAEFSAPRFWGGYEQAERKVLCLEPPDSWQEEPLGYLRFRAGTSSSAPGHRDYLGSILGLGLDRACLGDLLPDPQEPLVFYAVVLADKQSFIATELSSVGRCPVQVTLCDQLPPHLAEGFDRVLQTATVPSLRSDAVLAAMMHTSRARAAEYIAAGRVEVNHVPLRSAHELAYEEDIFTVRGVGRYRLAEVRGKSRKDRIFLSFFQY